MKTVLLVLGGAVVVINGALAFVPGLGSPFLGQIITALLGVGIIVAACAVRPQSAASVAAPPSPTPAAAPIAPTPAPAPVPAPAPAQVPDAPRAEAEIVALLALLQEKGRLVDFTREDIAGATDEQVGAAARVVHAGCRQVLSEYFEIAPFRTEAEGARVVLQPGYDAAAHRLLGSIPAQPPYTGQLLHPGWTVRSVKLPRVTGLTPTRHWPVLAPAEVEVTKS